MVRRMKTLGSRLKQAREEAGLSQKQLGKLVNVSQQAISKIEAGKAKGTYLLVPLKTVLKINLDWLSTGTGPMRPTTGDKNLDQAISKDTATYFVADNLFDKLLNLSEAQLTLISQLVDQMRPSR